MKKTLAIISLIVLLSLVVLFVALPSYFSNQHDQKLQQLLQAIKERSSGQVTATVKRKEANLFNSKDELLITYNFNPPHSKKTLAALKGQMTASLTTNYGPLLFTHSGVRFGQANMTITTNSLDSNSVFSHPLLSGEVFVSLLGTMHTNFSGLKVNNHAHVQFNGFSLQASGNPHQQVTGTASTSALAVSTEDATFNMGKTSYHFTGHQLPNTTLWLGDAQLYIPSIQFNANVKNLQGEIKSIRLNSSSTLNADNKLDSSSEIIMPSIRINDKQGSFEMHWQANNLNLAPLVKLNKMLNSDEKQQDPDYIAKHRDEIFKNVFAFFGGNSQMSFTTTANIYQIGKAMLKLAINNQAKTTSLNSLINLEHQSAVDNTEAFHLSLAIANLNRAAITNTVKLAAKLENTSHTTHALNNGLVLASQAIKVFTPESNMTLKITLPGKKNHHVQLVSAKAYFANLKSSNLPGILSSWRVDAQTRIPKAMVTAILTDNSESLLPWLRDNRARNVIKMSVENLRNILPMMIHDGYLKLQEDNYFIDWHLSMRKMTINNLPIADFIHSLNKLELTNEQASASFIPSIHGVS